MEKPYLSDEKQRERVECVHKVKVMVEGPSFHYAFLDEKWFYTTSRRKMNHIPRGRLEGTGVERVEQPRMRSRRHPIKVMFLGVVALPNPEKKNPERLCLSALAKRRQFRRGLTTNIL
ncbi:MAG: hypothetical protein ACREBR_03830 [bacterium]